MKLKNSVALNLFLMANLMVGTLGATTWLATPAHAAPAAPPPSAEGGASLVADDQAEALPEGASSDWWGAVQEDIRQSEYHVTWQEQTNLEDVKAAYQAPNRAHNLRTYFTPSGIRLIPRVFEEDAPPWELGLTLSGYGTEGDVRPVAEATLHVDANRIAYKRDALTEWYVNDERGLEQGFTLTTPQAPSPLSRAGEGRGWPHRGQGWDEGPLILDLALSGGLTPALVDDGQAIEFSTGGVRVLRYGELAAYDAAGQRLPARLSISGGSVRIILDDTAALYPITVGMLVTGLPSTHDWFAESDQASVNFGYSVGTAGDVNGDGYSDVIIGAPSYDSGQTNEGAAFVYHGAANGINGGTHGLPLNAAWTAEGDQADAEFGRSVGTAGDVNGDGYADVVIGAHLYDSGQTNEGAAFVYYGAANGINGGAHGTPLNAAWSAESDQAEAYFGWVVGTAGDINGDGYSDVIIGAHRYDNGQNSEGSAYVYHGSADGLATTANWTGEGDQGGAHFGYSVGTAGDVNGDGYADVIVGAYMYDSTPYNNEGRSFVFHGSAAGLSTTADWTANGDQTLASFGCSVGTAGDVNGDGYADVIIGAYYYDNGETDEGAAFVYHGSANGVNNDIDGTPLNAAWTGESDQIDAYFGFSVGTAGDVNDDGYADVIVGATGYDDDQTDEGRAYVYHGSEGGLATDHAWTGESDQLGACFGTSVGSAGDVNGDGYSDVIVGATFYSNGQSAEGAAFVYHGAADGLATTSAWDDEGDQADAEFGYSVGTAGDVNGDGYADVIVGAPGYDGGLTNEGVAYVYYGSATGLATSPTCTLEGIQGGIEFGFSAGTAGDVNGDGYADVIVGARYYDDDDDEIDEGAAFVYHGSATGLSTTRAWTGEGEQAGAWFGWAVGTAGDVNGDGFSDIIVGACMHDNGQTDEGRATVYHGSASGLSLTPAWTAEGNQAEAWFGTSVGTAGDVNSDGYADVIVGANGYDGDQTDEGQATVYHGSASGLSTTPDWVAEGNQAEAHFGYSVGTAGDVNGDGSSDVIVGAFYYDNGQTNEGRATVYHGSAIGLSTTHDWSAEGDQAHARFGLAVSTAGDVNGDGYADVIVGAHFYDNGQTNEGAAFVYHGSAAGLATTADWSEDGDQDEARFGRAVSTAGDVNGDGYSDVIVGAYLHDNGQTDEGGAFVYYGNGGDGLHVLPRQMRTDGAIPIAHLGVSDSGTSFQLSLIGRSPAGREDVRLQWQVAPLGTPFTATNIISGTSAWTDVLTTGVTITQTITGLEPGTPYHWRVRLLYRPGNAMGQPAGRWIHIPWNGWTETDLRTLPGYDVYVPLVMREP
jgi:hypothetical protein